jgi:hypothetical protein
MSLLYGDSFAGQTSAKANYSFSHLFYNNTKIVNAENLILPIDTLRGYDYSFMFFGASSLLTPPRLPATALAAYCYYQMFRGCARLTYAPNLQATSLASGCYYFMFYGCTSLQAMPVISATTLSTYCCTSMFESCTSMIATTPLIALTLAGACYNRMFAGCTSLAEVTMLATNVSASQALSNWLLDVSAEGTFYKAKDVEIPSGANGIPNGWTIVEL